MAQQRVVRKSKAGVQDLVLGKGQVTQTRGGTEYQIDRLDHHVAVDSVAEMTALDVDDFTRARVYSDTTTFVDYIYDPAAVEGEKPDNPLVPGNWVPKEEQVLATGGTTPKSLGDRFAETGITLDSVEDLEDLNGDYDSQQLSIKGWHPTSDVGGGILYWKPDEPKSNHNGGTVFSPTVPWTTATADYLDGVGETDPSGNGCWIRLTNKNEISVMDFGAVTDDGVTTTESSFQAALDLYVGAAGGGTVTVPGGKFALGAGLTVLEGVYFIGAGSETWETGTPKGTYLRTVAGVTAPVVTMGDGAETRTVGIADMKLRGNGSNVGLRLRDSVHNSYMERVVVQTCTLGFEINLCWNLTGEKLVAQQCDTGFKWQGTTGGTSSTYYSCLAYNCTTGFFLEQALSYSSFIACGTDSCGTSLYSNKGSRGVSFYNYGVEFGTTAGILIQNEAQIDFIGLHFGDHSGKTINLFEVSNLNGSVNVVGCNLGSSFSVAAPGKIFSIDAASRPLVTFVGVSVFGERGDLDQCVKIGGSGGSKISGVGIQEPQTIPIPVGSESNTYILTSDTVVLEPQNAARFLNGTPVFDVSNLKDGSVVTFINKDATYDVGLRTENNTAGSGIIRHPTNADDTLRMNDIGTSVKCLKMGANLYEILNQL